MSFVFIAGGCFGFAQSSLAAEWCYTYQQGLLAPVEACLPDEQQCNVSLLSRQNAGMRITEPCAEKSASGGACTFEGRTGSCINTDTQNCPSPNVVEFFGGECGTGTMGCCVPPTSSQNECQQNSGTCNASASCGIGFTEELYDCDNPGEACCVADSDPCTGGSCMSNQACTDAGGTPQTSCTTCTNAGEVYCVVGGSPGPGPGPGTGGALIEFENPLKYDTVQDLVGALLAALQGIIVLLSIIFIVIGAVMYVTSAGNQAMVTLAKGAILASMIGLAIGIAAPSFLKEIYDILGAGAEVDPTAIEGATPIETILMNTLNFLLAIIGVLSMIMLVIGGIMYLLAGGDQTRIDTGKKIVIYSIIGLTVALAALIIVRQIANFFG